MLDLMLMISTLENRSMLEKMTRQLETVNRKLSRLEDGHV
jgi:hypothetical protein